MINQRRVARGEYRRRRWAELGLQRSTLCACEVQGTAHPLDESRTIHKLFLFHFSQLIDRGIVQFIGQRSINLNNG